MPEAPPPLQEELPPSEAPPPEAPPPQAAPAPPAAPAPAPAVLGEVPDTNAAPTGPLTSNAPKPTPKRKRLNNPRAFRANMDSLFAED